MNMTTRELRLALKHKLEHRRELLKTNARLHHDLNQEKERNKFLLHTLSNPLVNYALEICADEIMEAIVSEAIKASAVVANQTIEKGGYEIGISISRFDIRKRICLHDFETASSISDEISMKSVRYSIES